MAGRWIEGGRGRGALPVLAAARRGSPASREMAREPASQVPVPARPRAPTCTRFSAVASMSRYAHFLLLLALACSSSAGAAPLLPASLSAPS
jgi:hypothetical protein